MTATASDRLADGFRNPPASARPWVYWWWLDAGVSKDGISRDLEAMKRQGIAAALLFDAGEGGPRAPKGPHFMSPAWRELFRFAVAGRQPELWDPVTGEIKQAPGFPPARSPHDLAS